MSWWEILIVIAVALFAVAIMAISLVRKKKGKPSCCSDCACCPYHKDCQSAKNNVRFVEKSANPDENSSDSNEKG